jgi:hypothetical protein
MLSAVVVVVLVAAFVLVAGVAGWVVRRLWTSSDTGAGTAHDGADRAVTTHATDPGPEA